MKQVVQKYRTGELRLANVPVPACKAGGLVVRTAYSLVSSGTERMKVDQARMSLWQKAKARPDQVKQVLNTMRQVGVMETVAKVRERLDALTPLGYSLSGVVVEVGPGIDDFAIGDRVACAGEGIACHAEFASAPRNLCVKVGDGVDMKDAAFATVGAIAMHGVRQAEVRLGDTVLVIGLGLVGLLAVQILKAAGCRVIGVDVDAGRAALARTCGAEAAMTRSDPALEDTILHLTDGAGVDATYVAASTSSNDPMELAGKVTRDRGRVVVVGMVHVEADWRIYYHKELQVVMSRSYGPGRYDRNYEQRGLDYPIGYVRWTQRRNLQEFVRLLGTGQLKPTSLGPAVFPIAEAEEAYRQLHDEPGKHAVGILFEYPPDAALTRRVDLAGNGNGQAAVGQKLDGQADSTHATTGPVGIGLIGAGNFATGTLIPALKKSGAARFVGVCSTGGLSAKSAARRHEFDFCASTHRELLDDPNIQAVVIATRHDTHAALAAEAARAGKHVFVEKPLALSHEQLHQVIEAQAETGRIILPGFNRRFSPLAVAVRDWFTTRESPIEVVCRINAGGLKADSWYQDSEEGGWRIVSEGCHWVDLIRFLCVSDVERVYAEMIDDGVTGGSRDNVTATLRMRDGSVATLIYVGNGDPAYEKERIEVFGQGRAAVIENWMAARLTSGGKTRKVNPSGTGKGHGGEMDAFLRAVQGDLAAIPDFESGVMTTLATLAIAESLRTGAPVTVNAE